MIIPGEQKDESPRLMLVQWDPKRRTLGACSAVARENAVRSRGAMLGRRMADPCGCQPSTFGRILEILQWTRLTRKDGIAINQDDYEALLSIVCETAIACHQMVKLQSTRLPVDAPLRDDTEDDYDARVQPVVDATWKAVAAVQQALTQPQRATYKRHPRGRGRNRKRKIAVIEENEAVEVVDPDPEPSDGARPEPVASPVIAPAADPQPHSGGKGKGRPPLPAAVAVRGRGKGPELRPASFVADAPPSEEPSDDEDEEDASAAPPPPAKRAKLNGMTYADQVKDTMLDGTVAKDTMLDRMLAHGEVTYAPVNPATGRDDLINFTPEHPPQPASARASMEAMMLPPAAASDRAPSPPSGMAVESESLSQPTVVVDDPPAALLTVPQSEPLATVPMSEDAPPAASSNVVVSSFSVSSNVVVVSSSSSSPPVVVKPVAVRPPPRDSVPRRPRRRDDDDIVI